MKKIISLFERDYEGTHLVYDEVVPGAEWVIAGEGVATVKFDGTCCMVKGGVLFKRYDRKLKKGPARTRRSFPTLILFEADFKSAPMNWIACEAEPNLHTGHWPGWVPVGDGPEDKYHKEAFDKQEFNFPDGTYELMGEKVQGNPYCLRRHILLPHGATPLDDSDPRNFQDIKACLYYDFRIEGIVWYRDHKMGTESDMVKIKSKDFGIPWPRS